MSSRKFIISSVFLSFLTVIIYSCQNAGQIKQDIYYTNGRDLYIKHCQNCHGAKGEGLGTLTPPLTDTTFLKVNKTKIACYIKKGINEPIIVNGKRYEDKMPGFPGLFDIDIAQLEVYVTNTFGNKQGMYTPEQVANDLDSCQ